MRSKTANKDAAIDINTVLQPDPPIDITGDEATIKVEVVELLSNIRKGDALTTATWKTLKSLGWKDTTEKVEKPIKAKTVEVKAKPKAKVEKTAEKKPLVVQTKIGRMELTGRVLATGMHKEEDVPIKADALYVKNGGKSNVELSKLFFSDACKLLRGLDILIEKNGKVSVKKA